MDSTPSGATIPMATLPPGSNDQETKVLFVQTHVAGIEDGEFLKEARNEKKQEKVEDEEEEEEGEENLKSKRIHWSNKREYILSTIGYCVGLGNLFRFPYLCNRNGGGAFLIPFVISLLLIGLPLFAMEVVLGQFSGRNAQQIWAICPLFKGVGTAMVITATIALWMQNSVLAWGFYYLVCSFRSEVPWSLCDQWWNTPQCYTYLQFENASSEAENASSSVLGMTTSFMNSSFGMNTSLGGNDTVNITAPKRVSSTEEFWQRNVLQLSSGFEEPGTVVWYLGLSMAFTYLLCFLALSRGIHSSGKVVYVTATAPYILLTILLIRGAMLPGAIDGILFYIKPDFAKLLQIQVWLEAALQVFFSLGPCWGALVVMASFNKFHNNCLRDSVMLTLVCEGTSIYGGFVIFSVLGFMAHMSGQDIRNVVSSGPGLAFILYPEAVSLMPLPQLWAVLFFIMIITLGIDSAITNAEVGLTTLTDHFPHLLRHRRVVVTAVYCFVFMLLSMVFVTQGGMYVFQLVDWFVAALSIIIIGFIECVVVGWIYGVSRFGDDIYLMIGKRPPFILCVFWKFITPCLLLGMLLMTLANYTPPTYGDYEYGTGGKVFGWCVALSSFIPIPTLAVYQLWKARGTLGQRLRQTVMPEYNIWRPADMVARVDYPKGDQEPV